MCCRELGSKKKSFHGSSEYLHSTSNTNYVARSNPIGTNCFQLPLVLGTIQIPHTKMNLPFKFKLNTFIRLKGVREQKNRTDRHPIT